MKRYAAYRRTEEPQPTWTRIEMILALYDGALTRLDKAEVALQAGETTTAVGLIARTQLIVSALASGVREDINPEQATNILRLYEYAVYELREPRLAGIANARKVLRTLREGFEAIRDEANELERSGKIPSAEGGRLVQAMA